MFQQISHREVKASVRQLLRYSAGHGVIGFDFYDIEPCDGLAPLGMGEVVYRDAIGNCSLISFLTPDIAVWLAWMR